MVAEPVQNHAKANVTKKEFIQNEKPTVIDLMVPAITHEINNMNSCVSFNIPILREYLKKLIPVIDDYAENHQELEFFGMTYSEFRNDLFNLVNNLEHASGRINDILSDLREFIRKGYREEHDWVDLKQVIEKGIAICRNKIRKRVKSFDVDIAEDLPLVYTDPGVLEQILVNLLINAAQAADKENSRVKLSVKQGEDIWRDHLIIEVSDNGCGMDIAVREKIFDPFFTTKASGGGIGLGLFISNSLVKVLGACIDVESDPGKGSTFRVMLRKRNPKSKKDCACAPYGSRCLS